MFGFPSAYFTPFLGYYKNIILFVPNCDANWHPYLIQCVNEFDYSVYT